MMIEMMFYIYNFQSYCGINQCVIVDKTKQTFIHFTPILILSYIIPVVDIQSKTRTQAQK